VGGWFFLERSFWRDDSRWAQSDIWYALFRGGKFGPQNGLSIVGVRSDLVSMDLEWKPHGAEFEIMLLKLESYIKNNTQ